MRANYKTKTNHILLYLVIGASGIHLLMGSKFTVVLFALLLFASASQYKNLHSNQKSLLYYTRIILAVIVVAVLQTIKFNELYANSIFSLIIVFSIAYLINLILRDRYSTVFINLIYIFSIISLVLYFIGIIYPQIFNFFLTIIESLGTDPVENKNFFFFTFKIYKVKMLGFSVLRNCGFLYEPGMFACVLLPALSFNTLIQKTLINNKNVIFIIAILTTFSTAAYISLAAFFIIYIAFFQGVTLKRLFIILIILVFSFGAFWQLEIIGGKIENQMELALTNDESQQHLGRIGSGLTDLNDVLKNPLLGKGRNVETRFGKNKIYKEDEKSRHRTNGVTDLMAAMGIPFFVFYMYLLFKSISKFSHFYNNKKYALLIFIIPYLIMASSQTIMFRPLFISFLFLSPFINIKK